MQDPTSPRSEYLERLADLLPPGEVARVCEDVESLILERAAHEQEEHPDVDAEEAERRALRALGSPERLADELVSDPLTVPLATRRLFVRALAALFAGHLLLSIVLTVAGSEGAAIPGLLGPLPRSPGGAVFLSVVTLFLLDAGLMLVLFVALGTGRSQRALRSIYVRDAWTRRGALEGLVLLALMALIVNVFLDRVFSVKHADGLHPFLAAGLRELVPFVNVVFGLFAVRHVLTLAGHARGLAAAVADAVACLAGVLTLVLAATRELVQMPAAKLGNEAAEVLDDLIERGLLIVLVLGALMLTFRFVRQAIRAWRLVRS